MVLFLCRRVALLVVTLLFSSFVIFSGLWLSPGDPLAALTGARTISPEAQEALRSKYHLDSGFVEQYWTWLTRIFHGDFGSSMVWRVDVWEIIRSRAPITIQLVLFSSIIILFLGVALGVLAGMLRGATDVGVVAVATFFIAVPPFVAAFILMFVFSVTLGWFPSLGEGAGLAGRIEHLSLPALALALPSLGLVARMTRVSVVKAADAEHVQTAVSRGIGFRHVMQRHILRNAAVPITTVAGVALISQLALSAVVERAFGLNGLGNTLVVAALSKDLAVVQGIAMLLVATFVVCNTFVDVLYAFLDPRIAAGSEA